MVAVPNRVERINEYHDLTQFTCGNKVLDDWLQIHALENDERGFSRVFVLIDDDGTVAGYFSLTQGGVRKADLPRKLGRGLPDVDMGAVLLGRLAVARGLQRLGLGTDLLVHAVERALSAAEHVAARFIAVDPIDETARHWYTKLGFDSIPGDPGGRMYLRLDQARAAF